jgi:protein-S-isoprenylcysteine O-methyltransferase Ste14
MLGLSLLIQGFLLRNKSRNFLGKPTIDGFYFYSGKLAIFIGWGFLISKALFPALGWLEIPNLLSLFAAIITCFGACIMISAFITLDISLKVGLPEEHSVLQTGGLYRISRNPIYVGVFLINGASCLYFPDPINLVCLIYGVFIHHQIIRGEEKFLAARFGEEWTRYQAKVRRYL